MNEHKCKQDGPAKFHLDEKDVKLISLMLRNRSEHKDSDDFVFCNADGSKLKSDYFTPRFNKHLKRCNPEYFENKSFNSHDWRRACNTKIYATDDPQLQEAMDDQQAHSPGVALKYYLNTMTTKMSSEKIRALRGVIFPQKNVKQKQKKDKPRRGRNKIWPHGSHS